MKAKSKVGEVGTDVSCPALEHRHSIWLTQSHKPSRYWPVNMYVYIPIKHRVLEVLRI
jgi:hypothetical protein